MLRSEYIVKETPFKGLETEFGRVLVQENKGIMVATLIELNKDNGKELSIILNSKLDIAHYPLVKEVLKAYCDDNLLDSVHTSIFGMDNVMKCLLMSDTSMYVEECGKLYDGDDYYLYGDYSMVY